MGVTTVAMKAPVFPQAAQKPFTVDRTSAAKSCDGITNVVVVAPTRLIARRKTTIVNLPTESRVVSRVHTIATIPNERAFNANPQSCKSCGINKQNNTPGKEKINKSNISFKRQNIALIHTSTWLY